MDRPFKYQGQERRTGDHDEKLQEEPGGEHDEGCSYSASSQGDCQKERDCHCLRDGKEVGLSQGSGQSGCEHGEESERNIVERILHQVVIARFW